MLRPHLSLVSLAVLLCACTDPPPPAEAPAAPPPAVEPPSAEPPPALDAASADKVLAPSPLELERRVRASGLTQRLGDLVPERAFKTLEDDKDRIAVRTGVVLADTLLRGDNDDKVQFLVRLGSLRDGMKALGTGQGLLSMIEDFIVAVENDTAAREDFLQELDAVASTMVPEHGWGPDDTSGPLLQAGAWLAGTNLVAQAIVAQDKPGAAEKLLRLGDVATYFKDYLATEGEAKAGGTLREPLQSALDKLVEVSARETLGVDDAREVGQITHDLLQLI